MIRQRKSRAIFGGTMAVGLVFVVAGAAFACTKYYGTMTGDGNGTLDVATTVNGNPNAGFFQWCESPPAYGDTETAKSAFWRTQVNALNPALVVTVGQSSVCLQDLTVDQNFLASGTYKVGISESYWDESSDGFATGDEDNCHTLETGTNNGSPGYGTILSDTLAVNSSGSGTVTLDGTAGTDIGGNIRTGWNTVCVYLPQGQSTDTNIYFNPANALNFRAA